MKSSIDLSEEPSQTLANRRGLTHDDADLKPRICRTDTVHDEPQTSDRRLDLATWLFMGLGLDVMKHMGEPTQGTTRHLLVE